MSGGITPMAGKIQPESNIFSSHRDWRIPIEFVGIKFGSFISERRDTTIDYTLSQALKGRDIKVVKQWEGKQSMAVVREKPKDGKQNLRTFYLTVDMKDISSYDVITNDGYEIFGDFKNQTTANAYNVYFKKSK